tara:strand:- start:220 stop:918 length:699 start_codon:yes stop_codon:yes gene_type:complete
LKIKIAITFLLIPLFILLFLGCQNNQQIDANPQTLLNDATSRINDWKSFKFRLEHEKGTTTISNGMELRIIEGEVVLPRRVKLTGKATVGGQFIALDIVLIDELSFMTNPLTGKWNQIDPEDSPFGNFDVREVIANILKMMKNPEIISSKKGANFIVKGEVIATVFEPLVGLADSNMNAEVHLELDYVNKDVKTAKIIGRINPLDPQEVIRIIKIWEVDGNIEVNPPIDPLK